MKVIDIKQVLSCQYFCFSFADLLAPHGIVQSFFFQQGFMSACFNYIPFFQYIDPVGMHDGGQAGVQLK